MARSWFGGSLVGWVFSRDDTLLPDLVRLLPSAAVTFWDAETGGTQVTDLLLDAAAVTQITSSDGTDGRERGSLPPFQGPDAVTYLWADTGAGARYLIASWDLGDAVSAHAASSTAVHGIANTGGLARSWRWDVSAYVAASEAGIFVGPTDPGSVPDGSIWLDTSV